MEGREVVSLGGVGHGELSERFFWLIGKAALFFMVNGPTTHGYLISADFLKFKK